MGHYTYFTTHSVYKIHFVTKVASPQKEAYKQLHQVTNFS